MSKAISDVIDNTKEIFMTDSALSTLLDFERVLDELDIYVYKNWKEGELVEGPVYEKYFVSCTFMWQYCDMPDPRGGERLLGYDCEVYYSKDRLEYAQEFARDYKIYLKSVEFTKKAELEFYKNNKILLILNKILNLPTNILKLIKVLKSKFILNKCLNEIEVIKKELNNYE